MRPSPGQSVGTSAGEKGRRERLAGAASGLGPSGAGAWLALGGRRQGGGWPAQAVRAGKEAVPPAVASEAARQLGRVQQLRAGVSWLAGVGPLSSWHQKPSPGTPGDLGFPGLRHRLLERRQGVPSRRGSLPHEATWAVWALPAGPSQLVPTRALYSPGHRGAAGPQS